MRVAASARSTLPSSVVQSSAAYSAIFEERSTPSNGPPHGVAELQARETRPAAGVERARVLLAAVRRGVDRGFRHLCWCAIFQLLDEHALEGVGEAVEEALDVVARELAFFAGVCVVVVAVLV